MLKKVVASAEILEIAQSITGDVESTAVLAGGPEGSRHR